MSRIWRVPQTACPADGVSGRQRVSRRRRGPADGAPCSDGARAERLHGQRCSVTVSVGMYCISVRAPFRLLFCTFVIVSTVHAELDAGVRYGFSCRKKKGKRTTKRIVGSLADKGKREREKGKGSVITAAGRACRAGRALGRAHRQREQVNRSWSPSRARLLVRRRVGRASRCIAHSRSRRQCRRGSASGRARRRAAVEARLGWRATRTSKREDGFGCMGHAR